MVGGNVEEIQQLHEKSVGELVPRPTTTKVIGCKWVLRVKRRPDGSLDKFKARLVALGCSQQFGVNYTETFSPVISRETIRMMFALTCEMGWSMRHVGVTSAYRYLNSALNDLIYMEQPECFVEVGKQNWVCKLKRTLYGLKQSGKGWYDTIYRILTSLGFVRSAI